MSFKAEQKQRIIKYLLENIEKDQVNAVNKTADNFEISKTTVYRYIKELEEQHIITKIKNGQYELVQQVTSFQIDCLEGMNEDKIYMKYIKSFVQELPDNVRELWEYSFGEMMNNVIDHADAKTVIILIATNLLKTSIVIRDNGIGIFRKIKEHFGFDSLEDAICELFKGKLTTDSKRHSGEGIFFTSRALDEFLILSDGKIFTHNKFEVDHLEDIRDLSSIGDDLVKEGTCVYMSLANNSKRRIVEVFDRYSNQEGGFSKTKILIKNMFEDSPISRSQAKRLCNRLEDFDEVELDFLDVEWMGQGFAHQVFVVFQNNNKDTKLTPVNMSRDVEKMYKHVLYK